MRPNTLTCMIIGQDRKRSVTKRPRVKAKQTKECQSTVICGIFETRPKPQERNILKSTGLFTLNPQRTKAHCIAVSSLGHFQIHRPKVPKIQLKPSDSPPLAYFPMISVTNCPHVFIPLGTKRKNFFENNIHGLSKISDPCLMERTTTCRRLQFSMTL